MKGTFHIVTQFGEEWLNAEDYRSVETLDYINTDKGVMQLVGEVRVKLYPAFKGIGLSRPPIEYRAKSVEFIPDMIKSGPTLFDGLKKKVKVKKEDLEKCESYFDVIELICDAYFKSLSHKEHIPCNNKHTAQDGLTDEEIDELSREILEMNKELT